jgi:hypothetical protein
VVDEPFRAAVNGLIADLVACKTRSGYDYPGMEAVLRTGVDGISIGGTEPHPLCNFLSWASREGWRQVALIGRIQSPALGLTLDRAFGVDGTGRQDFCWFSCVAAGLFHVAALVHAPREVTDVIEESFKRGVLHARNAAALTAAGIRDLVYECARYSVGEVGGVRAIHLSPSARDRLSRLADAADPLERRRQWEADHKGDEPQVPRLPAEIVTGIVVDDATVNDLLDVLRYFNFRRSVRYDYLWGRTAGGLARRLELVKALSSVVVPAVYHDDKDPVLRVLREMGELGNIGEASDVNAAAYADCVRELEGTIKSLGATRDTASLILRIKTVCNGECHPTFVQRTNRALQQIHSLCSNLTSYYTEHGTPDLATLSAENRSIVTDALSVFART